MKIIFGVAIGITLILILYLFYDSCISIDDNSRRFKKADAAIKEYVDVRFGGENIEYVREMLWNKHAFFMDSCKFYSILLHVDSGLEFEVLSDGRRVIGDTYNKKIWERKLNAEYEVLVKQVFGENATCRFRFTFDYIRSSQEVDDFTNISIFNEFLNRDIEEKNERNDKLELVIVPHKNFDNSAQIGIDEILTNLRDSKINYGSVTFEFSDVSKTYFYEG